MRNVLRILIVNIIKIIPIVYTVMKVSKPDVNGLFARAGATTEVYITIVTDKNVENKKVFIFFGQNHANC